MTVINMPGFTAEHSLYEGKRQSYSLGANAHSAAAAEIIPAACIVIDGQLLCPFPHFPVPKPGRCELQCKTKFRGPKLAAKLAACLELC